MTAGAAFPGRVLAAALLLAVLPAGVRAADPAGPAASADPYARVRGMTVSCPQVGLEWGSDEMVTTMETLRDLGCNWIAIHPYGGIRNDGTVGRSRIDRIYGDPSWLTRAIREAHRLGLKMMIKPHLAYWGTRFHWRGDIAFETDEEWRRFFSTYRAWILRMAELSAEADAFVVGTELDQTTQFEEEWRGIITAVREATTMPLTYSAGWDTYATVPFWDQLDVVAIQGYFPLVDHEGLPTEEELTAGWERVLRELRDFAEIQDRSILLGELGYPRSRFAAVRPWSYQQHADSESVALQEKCLSLALRSVDSSGDIVGAFLWKWFPGEFARGNFLQSTPEMRAVIRRHWD